MSPLQVSSYTFVILLAPPHILIRLLTVFTLLVTEVKTYPIVHCMCDCMPLIPQDNY